MTDAELRSIFKNDSRAARALDGDDSDSDPDASSFSPSSSSTSLFAPSSSTTTTSTTLNPLHGGGGGGAGGGSYNTGPKGVARDARAYQAHAASSRRPHRSQDLDAVTTAQSYNEELRARHEREKWVEARLKELSKSRKLERVKAHQYLTYIETLEAVLVLILDPEEEESERWAEGMSGLGYRYGAVKMIALDCEEAGIDHVACPAILLYEQGHLTVNAMRVVDELQAGEEIGQRAVEEVLLKLGALKQAYRLDRE